MGNNGQVWQRRTSVLGIPIVFPWLPQPPPALMSPVTVGERGYVMRAGTVRRLSIILRQGVRACALEQWRISAFFTNFAGRETNFGEEFIGR